MADEFVEMKKDGEDNIFVHPLAVENHKQLGWQIVEPETQSPAEADKQATDNTGTEAKKVRVKKN